MRKPTKPKPPRRRQPTPDERRASADRRALAHAVRTQRTIVRLATQLHRATERADRELTAVARWIAARTDDRELSRKLQAGDVVTSAGS